MATILVYPGGCNYDSELDLLYTILVNSGGSMADVESIYNSQKKDLLYAILKVQEAAGIGANTFENDLNVTLLAGRTLGKYQNGQLIPAAGKTAVEVIQMAIAELPNALAPTLSMTANFAAGNREIGEQLNITFWPNFVQNNGGSLIDIICKKNGTPFIGATNVLNVVAGSTTYTCTANYNAGVTSPSYIGSIPAGSVNSSNSIVYNGFYRYFFGATATIPSNNAEVRSLPNNILGSSNTFALNTSNTQTQFVIVIPNSKTLGTVIDANAAFQDITADFVQDSITMLDAGGNSYTAKRYVKTQTVPYDSNHQLNVTIL